jgi:hypothetical protein
MGGNAIIFLHPTLRNLTISCFDINEDIKAFLTVQTQTPLKSLTFDECNITVTGLAAVLAVPSALQKLTLGERMYHLSEAHAPLGRSPAQFLQALALQKDSLQYLKHIGGLTNLPGSVADLALPTFPNMKEMELNTHSILARMLRESASLCAPAIPPNLYLRLIRAYDRVSNELEVSPLLDVLEWVRRVPHLDYILDLEMREDRAEILNDLMGTSENIETWKKIFTVTIIPPKNADNSGAPTARRLRILLLKRSGFIPPYMYGEKHPEEGVLFDSESHKGRKP